MNTVHSASRSPNSAAPATTKLETMRASEERSAGRALTDYPIRLYSHHMAEIFGVSVKRFLAQDLTGNFIWAENRPRIGRKSWSRDRVIAYFAGEIAGLTRSKAS